MTDDTRRLPNKLSMAFDPAGKAVSLGSCVDLYADEQGSPFPSDTQGFAIGVAYKSGGISSAPILDALEVRRQTGQCRCAKRPFFHASEDCSRCRVVMASVIAKELSPMFFTSVRWEFSRAQPDHPHGGELHNHVLSIGLGNLFLTDGVQKIRLHFSKRDGLSEESLRAWFTSLDPIRLNGMIRMSGAYCLFPHVVVEEVGPEHPAAQIADHLLWADRPQRPDALEQAGLAWNFVNETPGPLTVRRCASVGYCAESKRSRPIGRDPSALPWEQLVCYFAQIEKILHRVADSKPPSIDHLLTVVGAVSRRVRGKPDISDGDFRQIHEVFLMLVDTLPAYNYSDTDAAQLASDAARLAALIVDARETRAILMGDRWRDIRRSISESGQAGECLGW